MHISCLASSGLPIYNCNCFHKNFHSTFEFFEILNVKLYIYLLMYQWFCSSKKEQQAEMGKI